MERVLKLLRILEDHQYKDQGEKKPVGGHGAGVCFLNESGMMEVHKVGKTNSSPVKDLSLIKEISQVKSRIVLGHVRRASKDLMGTVKYAKAAQPYKVNCLGISEIVSIHNGKVRNYQEVRRGISKEHLFQSGHARLVDSEVIPHLFEENIMLCNDEVEARKRTFEAIKGNNTAVVLTRFEGRLRLHILHKGSTRGMHVWKNDKGDIILCSRSEPLEQVFGDILTGGHFQKVVSIKWKEDRKVQQTCDIKVHSSNAEEKLREVTIETQVTWAVLLLTFLVGLVELLQELKVYHNILWLSGALSFVYLALAAGLSYSIIRFSVATLFVLEWRRLLPKELRDKIVYLSPLYERILFDKKQNLRMWIVYLVSLLSFIFWCIILIGKMLASA